MNTPWHALMRASLQPDNADCFLVERRHIIAHDQAGSMSEQDVKPDPPLTPEQALRVSRLKQEDLWEMDRVLLAQSAPTWRKVARVVGMTIVELSERIPDVPDIYYAQRVRRLVAVGELESQGNLEYMGYSEVRLPVK